MAESATSPDIRSIKERFEQVRENIEQACQRSGRSSDEISLLAVTKTFSLDLIQTARKLGLSDFGENRAGELTRKAAELPGEYRGGSGLRWHMIGHLQRNKAKDIVEHADSFLALDSPRLARELDKRAGREGRVLPCLAQVNITRQDRKYGIAPDEIHAYLDSLAKFENIHIFGLMAMAEFVDDPEDVRPQFREMKELFDTYDDSGNPRVNLEELSIGMSNDYEVAIEEGSTHVRLGSALFGARNY